MTVPLKPREVQEQVKGLYDAYPKHKGKIAAYREILKALTRVPFDELLPAVEAYKKSVIHLKADPDEWKYVPWPQRWFKEGRWDDELDPPPRGAPTYGYNPADDIERKKDDAKRVAKTTVGRKVCHDQPKRAASELATMIEEGPTESHRRWYKNAGVHGVSCLIAARILGQREFDRRVEAILAATSGKRMNSDNT